MEVVLYDAAGFRVYPLFKHGKSLNSRHNYIINGVLISSQEGDIYVEMGVPSMATCSTLILYVPFSECAARGLSFGSY